MCAQYNKFVLVVYFERDGGVETGWVLKENLLRLMRIMFIANNNGVDLFPLL